MFWELLEAVLEMYDRFSGIVNFDPVCQWKKYWKQDVTYFNEWSDYFGKMKSFAPPKKETKHVHVSTADLLHIVFRIENLDSCKYQNEPLEVFCEKRRSLKCRKVHRKLLCQRKYLWILQHLFHRTTPDNCFWNTNISITKREI